MSAATGTNGTEVSDKGISKLSSRSENGVDVALLWRQCDNTVIVAVVDHHNGDAFLLDVRENDNPLEMFHPYAYAAHRHVDHGLFGHGQDLRVAA